MIKRNIFRYFAKNIIMVISIVLIWRGFWYILDFIDLNYIGSHIYTSIGGIILGFILLYIPDHDLKEIEKL